MGSSVPEHIYALIRQDQLPSAQFRTCVYDGTYLPTSDRHVDLTLLTHTYVFNDTLSQVPNQSKVELAVYLPDSAFAQMTISTVDLALDPDTIEGKWSDLRLEYKDSLPLCHSQAKVRILRTLPAILFYSVCRVHYDGNPVRSAVTRHVIILNQTLPLPYYLRACALGEVQVMNIGETMALLLQQVMDQPASALSQVLATWMHEDPASELDFYQNYIKRVIWVVNGCPDSPGYGNWQLEEWMKKDFSLSSAWQRQINRFACFEFTRWFAAYQSV